MNLRGADTLCPSVSSHAPRRRMGSGVVDFLLCWGCPFAPRALCGRTGFSSDSQLGRGKHYQLNKKSQKAPNTTLRVDSNVVNCGLWAIMMCPYRFVNCNLYHPSGDSPRGGSCACVGTGSLCPSLSIFLVNLNSSKKMQS